MPETILATTVDTPIGPLSLLACAEQLIAGGFTADPAELHARLHPSLRGLARQAARPGDLPWLVKPVSDYFDGDLTALDGLATRQPGSAGRERLWAAMRAVPAGTVISYAALAAQAGNPRRPGPRAPRARPTWSPRSSPATGSCAPTAAWAATTTAWTARPGCCATRGPARGRPPRPPPARRPPGGWHGPRTDARAPAHLDSSAVGRRGFVRKVLIANRGEIAVRVVRACRDAGLGSVAVYAEPDRDALHVSMADEAYALGGRSAADSYLNIDKILKVAADAGADAVHPGYGFLAENAGFAQAVIDAGLTWIGPPPAAIEALGDKVAARQIANAVGAPMAPGTDGPVSGPTRSSRSPRGTACRSRSRPRSAAAAAGSRWPATRRRSPSSTSPRSARRSPRSAAASASWSATWTGRGTSRPSAWPTRAATWSWCPPGTARCSAATRSWSRRRPRRSCPPARPSRCTRRPRRSCARPGYVGAGTCEFLVGQDGTVSFLEVNTRLQVEHPVTEEVTGIDLVREMFRIADGEQLGLRRPGAARALDRVPDQRRGPGPRLPARARHHHRADLAGRARVSGWTPGTRPGCGAAGLRLAAGQAHRHRREPAAGAGAVPPGAGRVRGRGHAHGAAVPPRGRPRPGVHRRAVHACTPGGSRPSSPTPSSRGPARGPARPTARRPGSGHRRGRRQAARGRPAGRARAWPGAAAAAPAGAARRRGGGAAGAAASGDALASPMQGTIVKIVVAEGDQVSAGRHGRGARGDEDGAAADRAQGRHRHRPGRRRWARRCRPARSSARWG